LPERRYAFTIYLALQGRERGRAVVVGAGVGGLAAGIALRHAGFDVSVVEQRPAPATSGAGLWLWPNALRALDDLGALEAVRGVSASHAEAVIRSSRGRRLLAIAPKTPGGHPAASLTTFRPDLATALAAVLGPDRVRWGHQVTDVVPGDRAVAVRFADGNAETAAIVIGADGVRSAIRAALFDPRPPLDAGFTAYRAVIERDAPRAVMTWGCGARFGLMPLTHGRVNWFASLNKEPDALGDGQELKAALRRQFTDWPDPVRTAIEATPPGTIMVRRIFHARPLSAWNHGRVALLGDAAHAMTPSLGQGACQAFEDAAALRHAFGATSDVAEALARYDTLRRRRANAMAARSRRVDAAIQLRFGLACSLRDFAAAAVPARWYRRTTAAMWGTDQGRV
jgi:2-polyprenyl-6-methoxyphenol hydroxylase-like FAD-dependent oxidoreductase